MLKNNSNTNLTPAYGKLIRLIKGFPDFDFSFIKPVRKKAVELLNLKSGNRVIDAGCGPGGSFPFLLEKTGISGEIIGIEISPHIIQNTENRIKKNHWENIKIINSAAKDVKLTGKYDALLMFAAPDVYASADSMNNLTHYLNDGARIAFFGAKISTHSFGRMLNPFLKLMFKLSFSTTPPPENQPWSKTSKWVNIDFVKEYFLGTMFLASGTIKQDQ
ncbi:MAG: methyltransferase domain-containing protein [Ignavibacteria bacterium]|nr:methyltransferase domain-containing protein [Ignavibacteria bacterium]